MIIPSFVKIDGLVQKFERGTHIWTHTDSMAISCLLVFLLRKECQLDKGIYIYYIKIRAFYKKFLCLNFLAVPNAYLQVIVEF